MASSEAKYTIGQIEAALCVWEHLVENREAYKEHFEELGSAAMRFCAIQAGTIISQLWEHLEQKRYAFDGAFDWSFVPAAIKLIDWPALIEHNQYSGPEYNPAPEDFIEPLLKALPDELYKEDSAQLWLAQATAEAQKQWGYPELVSDHIDTCEQAIEKGEKPAEFIRWLGEKFDLTPRGDWS